jgi:hypothetical protein
MNLLHEGPRGGPGLAEALRPFRDPGAITLDGVAREEYLATVQVLQRMTANLEGAPAD